MIKIRPIAASLAKKVIRTQISVFLIVAKKKVD